MSVYGINGNALLSVYDVDGSPLSYCYDIGGNEVMNGIIFDDSTTVTDMYAGSLTSQPQGGCIDDGGNIYACFYSAGKFVKYNLNSGIETQATFTSQAYGHANGMTYNPNTGYLYIASMKDTGEVYVLNTSLELVDTLYALNGSGTPFNCWNIAYDRTSNRFITMAGGTIYFYDDDFILITTGDYNVSDWPDTRQDIETDGVYIYALSYSPNKIAVFDMEGKFVKSISNAAFTGEPESLCHDWSTNKYYIEGRNGTFVIRQVEFIEE